MISPASGVTPGLLPGKGGDGHFVSQVIDFKESEVSKSVEPHFPQQRLYSR